MTNETALKSLVKEKYGEIAAQSKQQNATSCCGATSCCTDELYNIMADDYTKLEGYNPDADLGLGCGLPTAFAKIKEGDTVIDLGSGAGNDCFVARAVAGEKGKVIGIDFTEKMIEKARENAEKMGYKNVEFRFGDIEQMPVSANTADVIVSNCVLNLVPNKQNVIKEIYRVLKPGAHFSISDIVLDCQLPDTLRQAAEMYAGCVSGALQKKEYMGIIHDLDFQSVSIKAEKEIQIPDEVLLKYLDANQLAAYRKSGAGIFSITVFAEKAKSCCAPGAGCC